MRQIFVALKIIFNGLTIFSITVLTDIICFVLISVLSFQYYFSMQISFPCFRDLLKSSLQDPLDKLCVLEWCPPVILFSSLISLPL